MIEQKNAAIGTEKYIEVSQGVKLHVTDKGEGRPVVLLPGLPMSDEMFKYTYEALVTNGYRVIGVTLRGFGRSDSSEHYDIDVHAEDLNTILDVLKLEDAVLAGYSFGGVIATYFMGKYRSAKVSRLVLISANVPRFTRGADYPFGPSIDDVNQLITFSELNLEPMLDVYGPVFRLDDSFMPLEMGRWINGINLQTTQKAMTAGLVILRDIDLRDILGNISVPTVIFHGREDQMVPLEIAEQALSGIPDSELVVFDKGGHWFIFTEQEQFHREFLAYIGK